MKKLTIQQTFNKVVNHLLSMRERAYEGGVTGGCRYLTEDGNRCAVGVLILDEYIHRAAKCGPVVNSPSVQKYLSKSGVPTGARAMSLLGELQLTHDSPSSWDAHGLSGDGLSRLTEIAEKFRLTMPEVSK